MNEGVSQSLCKPPNWCKIALRGRVQKIGIPIFKNVLDRGYSLNCFLSLSFALFPEAVLFSSFRLLWKLQVLTLISTVLPASCLCRRDDRLLCRCHFIFNHCEFHVMSDGNIIISQRCRMDAYKQHGMRQLQTIIYTWTCCISA